MHKGYTTKFIQAVMAADQEKLGVKLGVICINKDIPVSHVADHLAVSRMTVYHWFKGKTNVEKRNKDRVESLVLQLSS